MILSHPSEPSPSISTKNGSFLRTQVRSIAIRPCQRPQKKRAKVSRNPSIHSNQEFPPKKRTETPLLAPKKSQKPQLLASSDRKLDRTSPTRAPRAPRAPPRRDRLREVGLSPQIEATAAAPGGAARRQGGGAHPRGASDGTARAKDGSWAGRLFFLEVMPCLVGFKGVCWYFSSTSQCLVWGLKVFFEVSFHGVDFMARSWGLGPLAG